MRESGLGGWVAGSGEPEEDVILRSSNRGLDGVLAGRQWGDEG